ncbi:MAG: EAL domain-containing response regulator [Terracidiphilus sp.]|jgi:EAL domain-containing protein (putative c-di-GMP-specific phosphodiesterase class I)
MTTLLRVLVIDDERDVGTFIASASHAIGFDCTATIDAATFLKELTPETTLIFLDLMMPKTDGVEMLRLLSQQECKVPIVLMSGVGSRILETAEQLAQTLGLSIIGHLNKPFRLKELQSMLGKSAVPRTISAATQAAQNDIQDAEIRSAVEQDEFVLHYQPQIEISTGNVIGVEALVRWEHTTRGLIFPDSFIGRAEGLGLIDQLGWIVYDRGMREVGQFADDLGAVPILSLNVSVHSLRNLNFPDRFLSLIERHGLSAGNVTIEITESGLMKELSRTLDVLTRLRMKKVSLSIDDFGIGYAMMQQLRNVPATELKIDKSFVQNIHRNERDRVIAQKTIEIGHQLGMKVVGEGVETQDQMDFLRANHCDALQGYLFSRPLPAKDLLNWLAHYRRLGHTSINQ